VTIIFILIGWFIICALWGFIPLVEPFRLAAIANPSRRRLIATGSALLAFLTGVLILFWVSIYIVLTISVYESHSDAQLSQGSTQVGANLLPAANEILFRQFSAGSSCLDADQEVCALAERALAYGSPMKMLPVIAILSLLPALAAAFVCWKLTSSPQPAPA